MADPTTTTVTLPDVSKIKEADSALNAFGETTKDATSSISGLTSTLSKMSPVFGNAESKIKNLAGSFHLFEAGSASIDSLKDKLMELSPIIGITVNTFTSLSKSFDDFNLKSGIGVKSADTFSESLKTVTSVSDKLLGGLGSVGVPFKELVNILTKVGSQIIMVNKLEAGMMSLRSQFGGFKDQAEKLSFVKNIDAEANKLIGFNKEIGNSLNMTIEEINNYSQSFLQIPAAYKGVFSIGGTSMPLLQGAIKAAQGTTMDFKDSISALTYEWENFGKADEKGIELLTKTYDVSQRLGVRFDDLEKPIQEISNQFKNFGDNTGSSINMVDKLGKALQSTGLGIKPTIDIIQKLTGTMSGLNIAQKSFLSSQAGGAGGLRGGYEIDLLMQQGKMDEVYAKMKGVLMKQFGGKIVSTQEAAGSDQAAGQMAKQEAFLMQGPFGQLVNSQAQAQKLLSAFAAEEPIDLNPLKDSTQNAMDASNAWQEKMYNPLVDISNAAEQTKINTSVLLTSEFRKVFGGNNETMQLRNKSSMFEGTAGAFRARDSNVPVTELESQKNAVGGMFDSGMNLIEDVKNAASERLARAQVENKAKLTNSEMARASRLGPPIEGMEQLTRPRNQVTSTNKEQINVEVSPNQFNIVVTVKDQNGNKLPTVVQSSTNQQALMGTQPL